MSRSEEINLIIAHFVSFDPMLDCFFHGHLSSDWDDRARSENRRSILNLEAFSDLISVAVGRGPLTLCEGGSVDYSLLDDDLCISEDKSLSAYVAQLLGRASEALTREVERRGCVIALNLLAFQMEKKNYDHVVRGINAFVKLNPRLNSPKTTFLIMTRDLGESGIGDDGEIPEVLTSTLKDGGFGASLRMLGYSERASYLCQPSSQGIAFIEKIGIPSDKFAKALYMTESQRSDALVFGANMQIGHFALEHCHTRTHYDISEYLRRDSVRENAYEWLRDVLGRSPRSLRNTCFVVAGIHRTALTGLLHSFALAINIPTPMVFEEVGGEPGASFRDCVGSLAQVVVLADIVLTGRTVKECLRGIASSCAKEKRLRVLSVARMANSPDSIDVGKRVIKIEYFVSVNRVFYDKNNCPLCELSQPRTPRASGSIESAKGYRHDASQLTPLDVWEMVGERGALQLEYDGRDGCQAAKISTIKHKESKNFGLTERYGNWLTEFVHQWFASSGIDYEAVQHIVTINEPSGRRFAEIVARARGLSHRGITYVDRPDPEGGAGALEEGPGQRHRQIVFPENAGLLLVDDGINTGDTFRYLASTLSADSYILGGVVFDSKMSKDELDRLARECGMQGKIASLYNWLDHGEIARTQINEMVKRWDGERFDFSPAGALVDYCQRTPGATIDGVFAENERLYQELFSGDRSLDDDEQTALIVAVTFGRKDSLNALMGSEVERKFPLLAKSANRVVEAMDENKAERGVSVGRPSKPGAEETAAQIEWCPCAIVRKSNVEDPLSSGFLLRLKEKDFQGAKSDCFVVTCGHAFSDGSGDDVGVFIDGGFHNLRVFDKVVSGENEAKYFEDIALCVPASDEGRRALAKVGCRSGVVGDPLPEEKGLDVVYYQTTTAAAEAAKAKFFCSDRNSHLQVYDLQEGRDWPGSKGVSVREGISGALITGGDRALGMVTKYQSETARVYAQPIGWVLERMARTQGGRSD